jgi:hypothetical protein
VRRSQDSTRFVLYGFEFDEDATPGPLDLEGGFGFTHS